MAFALALALVAGACHLYTSDTGEPVGGGPLPDAGHVSDGCHTPPPDGGYPWYPDAALLPDGGYYYPDAAVAKDAGSAPDGGVIAYPDAGH
jgi:hypothetical protein